MYFIKCKVGDTEYMLSDQRTDGELEVIDPILDIEMGASGSLTFRILDEHPYVSLLNPISTEIEVFRDSKQIWGGRITDVNTDWDNIREVTCEGELSYLVDSLVRPCVFTDNGQLIFKWLIENHNSMVEPRKQFKIGIVTVTDKQVIDERVVDSCDNTLNVINSLLVEPDGGYLRVRYESDGKYIDWVYDFGGENAQPIRFNQNMLDYSNIQNTNEMITALIPYGATIRPEADEETGEEHEEYTVTIESVNDGKDYIYDQSAVDSYGWIFGTYTWDEIEDPADLLRLARSYLTENIKLKNTVEVNVIDLNLTEEEYESLDLGKYTRVISEPHGINRTILLKHKEMHLYSPADDVVTLGDATESYVQVANKHYSEMSAKLERELDIAKKGLSAEIEAATSMMVNGGLGGYLVINTVDGHPNELLVLDNPDPEQAQNVVRLNNAGFGFSRTGIEGPYDNAWTIDGKLNADYIRAGVIKGGSLMVGGKENAEAANAFFEIYDEDGNLAGRIDKSGIYFGKTNPETDEVYFKVDNHGKMTASGFEIKNLARFDADVINCEYIACTIEDDDPSAGHIECGWINAVRGTFTNISYQEGGPTSDVRLKHDIHSIDLEVCEQIVTRLRPVKFLYNESNTPSFGFIAQEVIYILKELNCDLPLTFTRKDGYYVIPYQNYVALLTGAYQRMNSRLERLERMVFDGH